MNYLLVGMLSLCVGMVIGRWITNWRWARNAHQDHRLALGNHLYEVRDVTPWKIKKL